MAHANLSTGSYGVCSCADLILIPAPAPAAAAVAAAAALPNIPCALVVYTLAQQGLYNRE